MGDLSNKIRTNFLTFGSHVTANYQKYKSKAFDKGGQGLNMYMIETNRYFMVFIFRIYSEWRAKVSRKEFWQTDSWMLCLWWRRLPRNRPISTNQSPPISGQWEGCYKWTGQKAFSGSTFKPYSLEIVKPQPSVKQLPAAIAATKPQTKWFRDPQNGYWVQIQAPTSKINIFSRNHMIQI